MANVTAFKYRAFLSYSHRDAAFAKWLHAALEGTRVDKDLVGKDTAAGPVPKSLRPIFRDRDDFAAGHSLNEQTLAALASSQFLVVLCSPSATRSSYVNEEIRCYKALGRSSYIIPVIVDGEPGNPHRECFPPALRFRIGPDGALTTDREEPVAADARFEGDGKEIAKQKVVAGLLGLGLDEVVRRATRARKRALFIRNSIIAVLVVLVAVSGIGFAWARYELSRNEVLLDRTLQRATGLVNQAVAVSEQFGVPHTVSVGILEQAEGLFRDMSELGRESMQLRFRKATMLIAFARNYAVLGNTDARWTRATEAHQLMTALTEEQPNDLAFQVALADTFDELGKARVSQGNLKEALDNFRAALRIRQLVAAGEPGVPVRQEEVASDYQLLGSTLEPLSRLGDALENYDAGLAIIEILAAANPDDISRELRLAALQRSVGEVLRDQGKADEALGRFQAAVSVYQRLGTNITDNAQAQRLFGFCQLRIGDIYRNRKDFAQALESYTAAIKIIKRLASADPSNVIAQRDLAWGYSRMGDALRGQAKYVEALTNYKSSLGILQRLVASDPNNFVLQREVDVQYYKVGDMMKADSQLVDALANYRISFAIAQRVASEDPGNGVWQCELARRYERVGTALRAQHNVAEAVENYRNAVAIGVRLTNTDPGNISWQEQLAYFYHSLAGGLHEEGNISEANEDYEASLTIAKRLAVVDPSRGYLLKDVALHTGEANDGTTAIRQIDDPSGYNRAFPCGQTRGPG